MKSPKKVNEISKYFKKNPVFIQKKSYAQASSNESNAAREMLKIKKAFSSLQNKKIKLVQKIISRESKPRLYINMTTKGPSCKQVIVSMSIDNTKNFVKDSSIHIVNINRSLKNIKLDIMANFIHVDNKGIVISTNKVVSLLDLQSIKKYVKNAHCIEAEHTEFPRLSQSKSYLNIIGILYLAKQSNSYISPDNIEKILKSNHIFNNIVLASKLRVIKMSPKSNMAIVWINIWDTQSGTKAKSLISRRFNIGSFIATICDINMNPGVPQCKNCWK